MFSLASLKEVAGLVMTYRDDPEQMSAWAEIFQPKAIEILGHASNLVEILKAHEYTDEEIDGVAFLIGYADGGGQTSR